MSVNQRVCVVCEKTNAQYRCASCASACFCSLSCYRVHSQTHLQQKEFLSHPPDDSPKYRELKEADQKEYDLGVPFDGILTKKQMHAIATDGKIRGHLRSKELQDLIFRIDCSRSRLDALETAEFNIPEFSSFVEYLAQVLFSNR